MRGRDPSRAPRLPLRGRVAPVVALAVAVACAHPRPHVPYRQRHIPLQGAENFRDLGGYATRDGRTVRFGLLFRSDDLSGLTDDDLETLGHLHLRTIFNLRSDREGGARAYRLPGASPPRVVHLPVDVEPLFPGLLRRLILRGDVGPFEFSRRHIEANVAYVLDFRDEFGALLRTLAEPGTLPALVHCTKGKDRTGFAAALVLFALGVPRDTVFEDYLLTNRYTAASRRRTVRLVRLASLFRVGEEEIRPLVEARPEYLQAALETIDEHYGSVEAYLREGLGLGDARLERLRAAVLE